MAYALAFVFALTTLAALFLAVKFASVLHKNKQEENANENLTHQYELILETVNEGIIGVDSNGRITFVNSSSARMLGFEAGELIGKSFQAFLHPPDSSVAYDETISPIHSALNDGVEHHVNNELFFRKDKSGFPVEYVCVPIKESGKTIGAVLTFEDITERKDLEEASAKARSAAIESARLKSEFLANVSHEIRTPMNGILGMTEILLDSKLTTEQRRTAETIKTSANSLLTIINDILDLSRIESGKLRIDPHDFNLRETIENLKNFFAESARAKSLELKLVLDENLPNTLKGDEGRIKQTLINLIGNAIKFTERGSVELRVTQENETDTHATIRFEVEDTGIGINEQEQQNLFQPFSQANARVARKHGGTGLGLAVSKQIVELMGGAIGVVSEEAKGSKFWFTARLEKVLEQTSLSIKPQPRQRKAQTFFSSDLPVINAKNLRVLVAEDNPVNQKVTLHHLNKLGIAAEVVSNGFEVLNAVSRFSYDIVFMDCQMPELDGYETTRLMRESEGNTKHTTIIATTANAMQGDRERCLSAGMDDYLAKPIIFDELHALVAKLTNQESDSDIHITLDQVMDVKVLDNLHSLEQNGVAHLAEEVLEIYLSHAPTCLQEMKEAFEKKDSAKLARASHTLKGSSSTLGMKRMTEICSELEMKSKRGGLSGANDLIKKAENELERISHAVIAENENANA